MGAILYHTPDGVILAHCPEGRDPAFEKQLDRQQMPYVVSSGLEDRPEPGMVVRTTYVPHPKAQPGWATLTPVRHVHKADGTRHVQLDEEDASNA